MLFLNMKITDDKILKKLIDTRDNGRKKQERTRAGAILLANSDVLKTTENKQHPFRYQQTKPYPAIFHQR